MHRALLVLALLVPSLARADATVTVQLSPEGQLLAQQLGVTPDDLAAQVKARIDDAYQANNVDNFLRSFTDATSFSARGLGVDYGSAQRGFLAGLGVNFAAAGDKEISTDQRPTAGLAANVALMIGANLAEWEHPRWTLFANGFYRNGSTQQLAGSILSAGAHLQYRLIEPTESDGAGTALRWIGLSLTSGIELTRWSLHADKTLSTDFNVGGTGGNAALTLDSTGVFDLTSTATTIPIEASTGIRIALLLTLYVGAGIDVTVGNSTVDAHLDGHLHTTDGRDIGTTTITGSGDHAGSPGRGRILAGAQINLWKLKLGGQVNVSQTPAVSVGVYLRFVQ